MSPSKCNTRVASSPSKNPSLTPIKNEDLVTDHLAATTPFFCIASPVKKHKAIPIVDSNLSDVEILEQPLLPSKKHAQKALPPPGSPVLSSSSCFCNMLLCYLSPCHGTPTTIFISLFGEVFVPSSVSSEHPRRTIMKTVKAKANEEAAVELKLSKSCAIKVVPSPSPEAQSSPTSTFVDTPTCALSELTEDDLPDVAVVLAEVQCAKGKGKARVSSGSDSQSDDGRKV
ncbi:hypothetical protein L208DRAFT_1380553 [Tricholoma matsutake]|nr:hypothetical protein L208DRAFT_1380553 [Tricholoma matsutake 945]